MTDITKEPTEARVEVPHLNGWHVYVRIDGLWRLGGWMTAVPHSWDELLRKHPLILRRGYRTLEVRAMVLPDPPIPREPDGVIWFFHQPKRGKPTPKIYARGSDGFWRLGGARFNSGHTWRELVQLHPELYGETYKVLSDRGLI